MKPSGLATRFGQAADLMNRDQRATPGRSSTPSTCTPARASERAMPIAVLVRPSTRAGCVGCTAINYLVPGSSPHFVRARSSTGQSVWLRTRRLGVRVPPGALRSWPTWLDTVGGPVHL